MKIALLLATYNGERYLAQQIDSLLNQTYDDFVIYISDDCSKDSTIVVINEYVKKNPEKIILLHNREHFGNARDNFFNLLKSVDADCYLFCDQDDFWLPNKVEKLVALYNEHKSDLIPVLIHSDLKVVDENLQELSASFFESMALVKTTNWKNIIVQNNVTGCTMLINRVLADYYKKNYSIINNDNILMHDYFFAEIAALCGETYFIDESLILYRQHGNNSVGAKNVKSLSYFRMKVSQIRTNKNLVKKTENQAGEVLKVLKNTEIQDVEKISLLNKYFELEKHTKIYRMLFLIKHKMLKNGIFRLVYQFIAI